MLLLAALAKVWAAYSTPEWDTRGEDSPFLSFLIIVWECLLAGWLWNGIAPGASWAFASSSFTVFAIVSLRTAWLGIASCGCFGKLNVNPWITFSVDVVVLTALYAARPAWDLVGRETVRVGRAVVPCVVAASMLLGATYFVAVATFGTWQHAKASLRGEIVTLEQANSSESHSPEEVIAIPFTVSNYGSKPVEVYGGSTDCSCQANMDLPLQLAPGEQKVFSVRLRLPKMSGVFRRRIYLLTDHEDARRVEATFSCVVAKSAE